MLKTNLFNHVADDKMQMFALAVKCEACDMTVTLNSEKVAKLERRLSKEENEKIKEGIKAEIDIITAENDKMQQFIDNIADEVAPVYDEVDIKLLRVLACVDNSKLEKYAIEWTDADSEALYNAMCNKHDVDFDKVDSANFKKSNDLLEKIVRLNCTIEESEYNQRINIRLTNNDLRMIDEAWVRGFRNKYKSIKDTDDKEYKETTANYLVRRKGSAKKGYTYDWSNFNALIVKIMIAKIANI